MRKQELQLKFIHIFFNTRMALFYMWAKGDKKTFFNRIYRRTTEYGKQTKKTQRERKRRIKQKLKYFD